MSMHWVLSDEQLDVETFRTSYVEYPRTTAVVTTITCCGSRERAMGRILP
jgi:hypothetical protein